MDNHNRTIRLVDLNPLVTCFLCRGYLIDVTTIIECLHAFCKSCIIKYFDDETNPKRNCCPKCQVLVHETKPKVNIRSDPTLQDLVYKLVPRLHQDELQRRSKFLAELAAKRDAENGAAAAAAAADSVENRDSTRPQEPPGEPVQLRLFYDEEVGIAIEYLLGHRPFSFENDENLNGKLATGQRTYLRCLAGIRVLHLKKLIRSKFELDASVPVTFSHKKDILPEDWSIADLAYKFSWTKNNIPLLHYVIGELPIQRNGTDTASPSPATPPLVLTPATTSGAATKPATPARRDWRRDPVVPPAKPPSVLPAPVRPPSLVRQPGDTSLVANKSALPIPAPPVTRTIFPNSSITVPSASPDQSVPATANGLKRPDDAAFLVPDTMAATVLRKKFKSSTNSENNKPKEVVVSTAAPGETPPSTVTGENKPPSKNEAAQNNGTGKHTEPSDKFFLEILSKKVEAAKSANPKPSEEDPGKEVTPSLLPPAASTTGIKNEDESADGAKKEEKASTAESLNATAAPEPATPLKSDRPLPPVPEPSAGGSPLPQGLRQYLYSLHNKYGEVSKIEQPGDNEHQKQQQK